MTGPAGAWTGTRPISSRPTSLVPPGNTRTGLAVAPPGGHSRQADKPRGRPMTTAAGRSRIATQDEREPPICSARAGDQLATETADIAVIWLTVAHAAPRAVPAFGSGRGEEPLVELA